MQKKNISFSSPCKNIRKVLKPKPKELFLNLAQVSGALHTLYMKSDNLSKKEKPLMFHGAFSIWSPFSKNITLVKKKYF
jgi:hypothetical protein